MIFWWREGFVWERKGSCTLTLHPYSVLPQQAQWEDCGAVSAGSPLEPGREGDLGYIRQECRPSAGFRNSAV